MDLGTGAVIHVGRACQEAEIDEQWSYVFEKSNQRWLWHAVDHATNTVLAYVFEKRKDEVFKKLKELLEPFGIKKLYVLKSRYIRKNYKLSSILHSHDLPSSQRPVTKPA